MQPECLIEAGGKQDGVMDFWQLHTYAYNDYWGTGSPFNNFAASDYDYDLPVVIGEFPTELWEQTNNGVPLPNDETTEEMVRGVR